MNILNPLATMSPSPVSPMTAQSIGSTETHHARHCDKFWVDPCTTPQYGDVSRIRGNAPEYVKQLNNNTFGAYAVGEPECFAYSIGKSTKFVEIDVLERQGSLEARTVAEVFVTKGVLATLLRTGS